MEEQDQAMQTDGRRQSRQFFRLTLRDVLTLISALILPLVIVVFIITTTSHQKEVIRQTESDRLQRQLEWEYEKNQSEYERESASMQNDLMRELAREKYRDEILVVYIKETGDLLKENNGSLTSSSVTAIIARAKTLNTIRQLDARRSADIIRFLYEARQLTDTNQTEALDISTVELFNISKNVFKIITKVGELSLRGIYLRNCTLTNTTLHSIDFSTAQLDYVNFSVTELHNITITLAEVSSVEFTSALLKGANFSSSHLNNIKFSSGQSDHNHHSCARLDDVKNSFTRLINVDFASATLQYVDFVFAKLQDVNFTSAEFKKVHFSSARLDYADFRSTKIYNVDFSFVKISHIDFSEAQLENVNFSFAELSDVQFSSARLVNVNFSSAILNNVEFSYSEFSGVHFPFAILVSVNFRSTFMPNTSFVQTSRMIATFDHVDLSMSVFSHANVKGANFYNSDLTSVNFSHANLQKTDFTGAELTESQLRSALSIRDARLSNGMLGRDPNLINNGEADCNSSLVKSWELKAGNIIVMMSDKDSNNCYFVLQSYATGAVMAQRISLSNVWNSHLWPYSQAVLNARMGKDVSIQLSGISSSGQILSQRNSTSINSNINMRLQKGMQTLEILVEFRANFNKTDLNNSWCDDIELFIDYGTESEFLTVSRASWIDIHPNAKWKQNGITVAGGNGYGDESKQFQDPQGLYVDEDQTIYIADASNHRIMEWKCGATSGKVVAGGSGSGNGVNQLDIPFDVIVDKERDSLIICDRWNERVVRWPRRNGTSGETIISNIDCWGLTMDENGSLYGTVIGKHEVRRYRMGESEGTVMAGGNGRGSRLDQLSSPTYVFVDRDHSVYVSDSGNSRVMKWEKGATEGIVVAGGQGQGNSLSQLNGPQGVVVDQLGTVYVTDQRNSRIMRWRKGDTQGILIAGGNGAGGQLNQLNYPYGLSFDRHGNLYAADTANHRVQKFEIE